MAIVVRFNWMSHSANAKKKHSSEFADRFYSINRNTTQRAKLNEKPHLINTIRKQLLESILIYAQVVLYFANIAGALKKYFFCRRHWKSLSVGRSVATQYNRVSFVSVCVRQTIRGSHSTINETAFAVHVKLCESMFTIFTMCTAYYCAATAAREQPRSHPN